MSLIWFHITFPDLFFSSHICRVPSTSFDSPVTPRLQHFPFFSLLKNLNWPQYHLSGTSHTVDVQPNVVFTIVAQPKMSPTERHHILPVNLKRSLQRGVSWNSQQNIDTLLSVWSAWSDLFEIIKDPWQYFCLIVLRFQNRLFVTQCASLNQKNFISCIYYCLWLIFVVFCWKLWHSLILKMIK